MVTSTHLNRLLQLIFKLIMENIGDESAEWLTNIALYAQQIIIVPCDALLKDLVLPLTEKCRTRVEQMFHREESCRGYLKAAADDASQVEGEIQEEWSLIARDIYAFYPLLIKYVDLQRSHWIRHNVAEAEFLYNHVGEIFNLLTTSVYFRREETNFVTSNEIDTMALIMPSGSRARAATSGGGGGGANAAEGEGGGGKAKSGGHKKKKVKKEKGKGRDRGKDASSSLVVVALKRLLPVGLNLFAGSEQELVQHCKDKFLTVRMALGVLLTPSECA